jgi:hypothetical protein
VELSGGPMYYVANQRGVCATERRSR